MCAHVVVAEDDPKQAELIRRYLEHEGHRVAVVHDGRAALEEARAHRPDLMVLDVMMPRMDGLDVCRVLRADSALAELPVLMLTARSTEDDLLLGLDLGADDYMTKPYSPRELMARVRTLLRRSGHAAAPADPVLRVGALTVDPVRHEVTADGRPISCTPGEFALLALLAAEPGRVFTRAQIIQHLHGFDRWFTSRTVDVHVMNLRRKIEPAPDRPTRLLTVYGVGYKLEASPDRAPAPAPRPARDRDRHDGA
ncbi:response regulator transcription factor [Actinacidiphila acididurans]|uniref:Response regulator transcription factor n=1 Tax=Actinacidiphila acididurans TaxID=2784346 RepID=A0ABS2TMD9_9ACTN|nr:response regulator transcription factor [Actinacidiphila acididurans]MBM9504505.1 response regulator transcription factor [Actinacidiphila acididurans]